MENNNEAASAAGTANTGAVAEGVDTAELPPLPMQVRSEWPGICYYTASQMQDYATTYGAQQREAGRREMAENVTMLENTLAIAQTALESRNAVGLAQAIEFIEKRAEEYARENASDEYDTGVTVWHFGDAGRDYHNTLVELADDLRALSAVPPAEVDYGDVRATEAWNRRASPASQPVEAKGEVYFYRKWHASTWIECMDGATGIDRLRRVPGDMFEFRTLYTAPAPQAAGLTDEQLRLAYQKGFDDFAAARPIRHESNYAGYHSAGLKAVQAAILAQQAKGEKQ